MEGLITSSRSTGIIYMELNELKNMIYNFVTFSEILQAFKLCLLENLSSYINHNLQQVDKIHICKWRFIFFCLPEPSRIWLLQLACLRACDPTTTSYTNYYFNLFSLLFPNYFVSLCCTMTLLMLLVKLLISCVFYKILVSFFFIYFY